MAVYRHELTTGDGPGFEAWFRAAIVNYPLITRWKMHTAWRGQMIGPALTINTLSETSPGVNEADLANTHIALANEIKQNFPAHRVILTQVLVTKLAELP